MVRIEFSTENSAFDDEPATEAARIVREIAGKIASGESFDGPIFDSNGNRIGHWSMDERDE